MTLMISHASPITRSNLREQALAVIREGIVSGELKPDVIYSAAALAAELGVSASPVREAMLTLVNQGQMEAIRNRGFRVVAVQDADRREIVYLRSLLEIPAMQDLAGDPTVAERYEEFKAVAEEIVDSARKGDLIGFLDSDRRFHLGLLAILGNGRLVSIVEGLRDQTRLYGVKAMAERNVLTASAEEHLPILDAMVAGDKETTGKLMRQHFAHITSDWANGEFA